MALLDRPFGSVQGVGLAVRIVRSLKGAWERYVARLEETELTEAQCKDAGIEWGDLEAARVKRRGLVR